MERVKVVRAIVHVPLKPGSRRSGNSEGAGAFLLHQPAIRRHDKRRPQCGVETAEALGIGYAPKGMMKGYVAIPIRLPTGELWLHRSN